EHERAVRELPAAGGPRVPGAPRRRDRVRDGDRSRGAGARGRGVPLGEDGGAPHAAEGRRLQPRSPRVPPAAPRRDGAGGRRACRGGDRPRPRPRRARGARAGGELRRLPGARAGRVPPARDVPRRSAARRAGRVGAELRARRPRSREPGGDARVPVRSESNGIAASGARRRTLAVLLDLQPVPGRRCDGCPRGAQIEGGEMGIRPSSAAVLLLVGLVASMPASGHAAFTDSNLAVSPATQANGGGCYPVSINPGLLDMLTLVAPEWAAVNVGSHLPPVSDPVTVHGTVNLAKINESGDFPGDHVSDDENTFITVDSADMALVGTGNVGPEGVEAGQMEVEWEIGSYPLFAWPGT